MKVWKNLTRIENQELIKFQNKEKLSFGKLLQKSDVNEKTQKNENPKVYLEIQKVLSCKMLQSNSVESLLSQKSKNS